MSRKAIALFSTCCLAALLSMFVYFLSSREAERAVPTIVTLSSEQLLGLGYTEATAPDTSGIWEDDDFSYSSRRKENSSISEISFPLDLNAATADELMQIKGIGPATAENIISYRTAHGSFHSVDELLNVDGIGSKKLSEIQDHVYIDPEITSENAETTVPADYSFETASTEASSKSVTEPESQTETVTISSLSSESESGNGFPIELNTASAEELMKIDGVGESIAAAIVEYANSVGFKTKNDLMNVPGIGEKRFENISPYVYVEKTE